MGLRRALDNLIGNVAIYFLDNIRISVDDRHDVMKEHCGARTRGAGHATRAARGVRHVLVANHPNRLLVDVRLKLPGWRHRVGALWRAA